MIVVHARRPRMRFIVAKLPGPRGETIHSFLLLSIARNARPHQAFLFIFLCLIVYMYVNAKLYPNVMLILSEINTLHGLCFEFKKIPPLLSYSYFKLERYNHIKHPKI